MIQWLSLMAAVLFTQAGLATELVDPGVEKTVVHAQREIVFNTASCQVQSICGYGAPSTHPEQDGFIHPPLTPDVANCMSTCDCTHAVNEITAILKQQFSKVLSVKYNMNGMYTGWINRSVEQCQDNLPVKVLVDYEEWH